MDALIGFWSHALAAALFASLVIWRIGEAARQPLQRLLAGAFALTACWAWLAAVVSGSPVLAFAGVIGLQLIGDTFQLFSPSNAIAQTGLVLRITTAAGALVLVHNVYGQAAPASRSNTRFAMLGLALIWIYDL